MNNNNFNLALQSFQKNNLEDAVKICNDILKNEPNHFDSIFLIGSIEAQRKNFNNAKKLKNKNQPKKSINLKTT